MLAIKSNYNVACFLICFIASCPTLGQVGDNNNQYFSQTHLSHPQSKYVRYGRLQNLSSSNDAKVGEELLKLYIDNHMLFPPSQVIQAGLFLEQFYYTLGLPKVHANIRRIVLKLMVQGIGIYGTIPVFITSSASDYAHYYGNGILVVNLNTLNLVDSEDELAFIISHELAHHTLGDLGHIQAGVNYSLNLAAAGLALLQDGDAKLPPQSFLDALRGNYSDKFLDYAAKAYVSRPAVLAREFEADQIALKAIIEAGYSPEAAISVLSKIEKPDNTDKNKEGVSSKSLVSARKRKLQFEINSRNYSSPENRKPLSWYKKKDKDYLETLNRINEHIFKLVGTTDSFGNRLVPFNGEDVNKKKSENAINALDFLRTLDIPPETNKLYLEILALLTLKDYERAFKVFDNNRSVVESVFVLRLINYAALYNLYGAKVAWESLDRANYEAEKFLVSGLLSAGSIILQKQEGAWWRQKCLSFAQFDHDYCYLNSLDKIGISRSLFQP